jgi:hypothetical protein
MKPLFDSGSDLVGWTDGRYVFDWEMRWVAWIGNGAAWSAQSGQYLGPVRRATFMDPGGRVVAWSTAEPTHALGVRPLRPIKPIKPIAPIRPIRPITPIRPNSPVAPLGGWSGMSFAAWLE